MKDSDLDETAKKVLSFTDNRQDASLQSGHFNDFISTSLLRSTLNRVIQSDLSHGFYFDELPDKVIEELNLDHNDYCAIENPGQGIIRQLQQALHRQRPQCTIGLRGPWRAR